MPTRPLTDEQVARFHRDGYLFMVQYKEHHHPRYTPLAKVADAAIKAIGAKPTAATQRFLKQDRDDTTRRVDANQ